MNLIYGEADYVSRWVQAHIPQMHAPFGKCEAIGFARNGELLAGVVYHDYLPRYGNLQISVAALPKSHWLTRPVLYAAFWYPFGQLKCNRVTALIARKNKQARHFSEKIGWKLEGVVRQGFYPDDACIYGMLRSECKWIRPPLALAA